MEHDNGLRHRDARDECGQHAELGERVLSVANGIGAGKHNISQYDSREAKAGLP